MEKALNLLVEDMHKNQVPTNRNVLHQKALSLLEDFSRDYLE